MSISPLLSGKDGDDGVGSLAVAEWRHRDKPRACWLVFFFFFFFSFQDGCPPLHSAVSGNHQEMVELLIEKYKADPTAPATLVRLLPMSSYKI